MLIHAIHISYWTKQNSRGLGFIGDVDVDIKFYVVVGVGGNIHIESAYYSNFWLEECFWDDELK